MPMPTQEQYTPHEKPVSMGGGPAGVAVGIADAVPYVAELVTTGRDANSEAVKATKAAPPQRSGAMRCREPEAVAIERIVKVMRGLDQPMQAMIAAMVAARWGVKPEAERVKS